MALADFTAIDVMWICLSVFLAVVGVTLAFLLVRLAGSASRLTALLKGLEETVPPVLEKAGGTVDRVNLQLDKVDIVTDSAVGAADAADTAVRAVSMAITKPVTKISGLAKGISHGASALWAGEDLKTSMDVAKKAAARREQEIDEELRRAGRAAWEASAGASADRLPAPRVVPGAPDPALTGAEPPAAAGDDSGQGDRT